MHSSVVVIVSLGCRFDRGPVGAQILFLRTPSVLEAVLGQHTGVGGPAVHLRHLSVLVVRRLARSRVLLLIVI